MSKFPNDSKPFTAYLAATGFEHLVAEELKGIITQWERLFIAAGPPQTSYWSQNVWLNPKLIDFTSIGDAARKLTAIQRNWSLYSTHAHRRAQLIQEKLPFISPKPVKFPTPLPRAPLGSWTLVDENRLMASPACTSPFPHGEPAFLENKLDPPSRAYLKLYEALTLFGELPQPGETCLDLGASPGGWTWVLTQLGAKVIAVDRSPLAESLMNSPLVTFRQGNAFSMLPTDFEQVDWLVCDVICYPEKLLNYLQLWLHAKRCPRFICTIKFQGEEHYQIIPKFAAIPGSRILHLANNKHELTWMLNRENSGQSSSMR